MATRYPFKFESADNDDDDGVGAFLRELWRHLILAGSRLKYYDEFAAARGKGLTSGRLKSLFVMCEDALYLDAAITLEKLYDPDGDRSIPKFLHKCEQSLKRLAIDNSVINKDVLVRQTDALSSHDQTYKRLKTLRDKWLAHHDKEAFDVPERFLETNFLPKDELQPLLQTAQEIVRTHFRARDSDVVFDLPDRDKVNWFLGIWNRYLDVGPKWAMGKLDSDQALELLYPQFGRLRGEP